MTVAVKRRKRSEKSNPNNLSMGYGVIERFTEGLSIELLMVMNSVAICLSFSTFEVSFWEVGVVSLLGFLCLVYLIFLEQPYQKLSRLQNWLAKYGLMPLATALITGIFWLDKLILPSQAAFFSGVSQKINGMFSGTPYASTATTIINVAINVMQVLMIGYILFGVAKSIQAGRDDEDWKQPLKLPLLVLFAVTVGDLAIGLL